VYIERLAQSLEAVIESQRNLEYSKQELALLPDYNLTDNFNYINQGEGINLKRFQNFLEELGISEARNSEDLAQIFDVCDFDKDEVINEEEWGHILTPL
jgi:Ca2+-binding EF-hand superfamily protein